LDGFWGKGKTALGSHTCKDGFLGFLSRRKIKKYLRAKSPEGTAHVKQAHLSPHVFGTEPISPLQARAGKGTSCKIITVRKVGTKHSHQPEQTLAKNQRPLT
jgi:hypothetical protein